MTQIKRGVKKGEKRGDYNKKEFIDNNFYTKLFIKLIQNDNKAISWKELGYKSEVFQKKKIQSFLVKNNIVSIIKHKPVILKPNAELTLLYIINKCVLMPSEEDLNSEVIRKRLKKHLKEILYYPNKRRKEGTIEVNENESGIYTTERNFKKEIPRPQLLELQAERKIDKSFKGNKDEDKKEILNELSDLDAIIDESVDIHLNYTTWYIKKFVDEEVEKSGIKLTLEDLDYKSKLLEIINPLFQGYKNDYKKALVIILKSFILQTGDKLIRLSQDKKLKFSIKRLINEVKLMSFVNSSLIPKELFKDESAYNTFQAYIPFFRMLAISSLKDQSMSYEDLLKSKRLTLTKNEQNNEVNRDLSDIKCIFAFMNTGIYLKHNQEVISKINEKG